MIWNIVSYYIYISIFIGVIYAVISTWHARKQIFQGKIPGKSGQVIIDEQIEKGHIQKETYGDRDAYYEKDAMGTAAMKSVKWAENFKQGHFKLYFSLVLIVGVIHTSITWPKMAYESITSKEQES